MNKRQMGQEDATVAGIEAIQAMFDERTNLLRTMEAKLRREG